MCVRTRQQADPRASASLCPLFFALVASKNGSALSGGTLKPPAARRVCTANLKDLCALKRHCPCRVPLGPLYFTHLLHFELLPLNTSSQPKQHMTSFFGFCGEWNNKCEIVETHK